MSEAGTLAGRIRAGQTLIGTWFTIPHPMVAEVLAQGGFDFLLLDGEHGPVSPDTAALLLPSTELHGGSVIYRVRANRVDLIRGALDAGVSGVMVPMVETVADALAARDAARYPPLGRRGIGPWRASNYYEDYVGYVARANKATCLIVQIESAAAVEQVDSIAAVEGIEVLFVGPADLAASMGLRVGETHPDLMAAIEQVAAAAHRRGKAIGIDVTSRDTFARFQDMGFTFFTHNVDTSFLLDGARAASAGLRTLMAPET
jgi:2-keto-3-deoxy-L-rhamnonate aldolase RhmA